MKNRITNNKLEKLIPLSIHWGNKQNRKKWFKNILLLTGLLLVLSACGNKAINSAYHLSLLKLKQNLSEPVDSLHAIIGQRLTGLVVDKTGNIYLEDASNFKIDIVNPKGHYVGSMGRKGRGPGEFEFMGNMSILGDTLFILQPPNRLSLFSIPNGHLIQTDNIAVPKIHGHRIGGPETLNPLKNGDYEIISLLKRAFESPGILSIYNQSLEPVDTLVHSFLPNRLLLSRKPRYYFYQYTLLPKNLIAFGPHGTVYETRSDSTRIQVYNTTGKKIRDISFKYNLPVLTQDDLDSLMKNQYHLSNNRMKNLFRKAIKQSHVRIPGRWMVTQQLLVDSMGRCWVEMVTPGKPTHLWWVFDKNDQPKWKFKLDRNVHLYVVRNGEVYGIWRKHGHYPRIERYKIERMN